jgi:S-methylmethionine-dependent homocysteine/selenocysteine methylase
MITILDGPLGTELDARGVKTDDVAWSARAVDSNPQIIASIHQEYAAAGATVHTANTFRTKRRSVGEDWARMATAAVQLAKSSVPSTHRVAGSIAPLEDCYRPDLSPGDASRDEHRELAEVLVAAGANILLCETFAHVGEAIIAVEESVRTGSEAWLAFTAGPNGDLMRPADMAAAARRAVEAGASAVLVNCTPADDTLRFIESIGDADLGVPFGAYANSGSSGWQSSEAKFTSEYANHARLWVDAGASLIGGCCGVTPAHISRIKETLT